MAELPALLTRINTPQDLDNLSDLEKKHLPVIEAPDSVKAGEPFEVTVQAGKLLAHPNEPGHHIESIELYQGHVLLARVDLAGGLAGPKVTFTVLLASDVDDPNGGLRAFEKCNLHGTWEGARAIEVG
ncbi:MAG: superoxide reductase [Anaerolineaceae bacterium]|nr:superoxide reductase [Anaerolineaceae bacterium]